MRCGIWTVRRLFSIAMAGALLTSCSSSSLSENEAISLINERLRSFSFGRVPLGEIRIMDPSARYSGLKISSTEEGIGLRYPEEVGLVEVRPAPFGMVYSGQRRHVVVSATQKGLAHQSQLEWPTTTRTPGYLYFTVADVTVGDIVDMRQTHTEPDPVYSVRGHALMVPAGYCSESSFCSAYVNASNSNCADRFVAEIRYDAFDRAWKLGNLTYGEASC